MTPNYLVNCNSERWKDAPLTVDANFPPPELMCIAYSKEGPSIGLVLQPDKSYTIVTDSKLSQGTAERVANARGN